MRDRISEIWEEQEIKNNNGTLTVGEALCGQYYRLLDGPNAGRVIIHVGRKIDDKLVVTYANSLTWDYFDNVKNVRCEITRPSFPPSINNIDRSKATWYGDNSDIPRYYNW